MTIHFDKPITRVTASGHMALNELVPIGIAVITAIDADGSPLERILIVGWIARVRRLLTARVGQQGM